MATLSSSELNLYNKIKSQLASYGLGDLAQDILSIIYEYGADMPETVDAKIKETEAYRKRFAANFDRINKGLSALSEAEYISNENQYREILARYGSGDLATQNNLNQFISGDISPNELSLRFNYAIEKVQKADDALKSQLRKMYPGISDTELARSLMMGKEGAAYLKTKIGQAEISAEAATAGLNQQVTSAELESLGVTRETARVGFGKVAENISGMKSAASRFRENVDAKQLQSEMEKENLLGQQSKRTKRLASQARGEFGGRSGLGKGSLKKTNTSGI